MGMHSIHLHFILDQVFIVVKTLYICWIPHNIQVLQSHFGQTVWFIPMAL